MKKYIVILFATLLGLQTTKASPIMPYNENGYTVSDVKNFAFGNSNVATWWRSNAVRLINNGLSSSGETVVINESNLGWALDNVTTERISLPIGFTNSRRFGDKGEFYNDKNSFDGMVGVFKYGKCSLVLYKTICMNLLEVPVRIIQTLQSPQQVVYYQQPTQQVTYVQEISRPVVYTQTQPAYINQTAPSWAVNVNLNFGGGHNNCGGYQQSYHPQYYNGYHPNQSSGPGPIRTMPVGIPSGNNNGNGGIPAVHHTMPGGISRR